MLDGAGCPVVAEVNAVVHREWRHLLGEEAAGRCGETRAGLPASRGLQHLRVGGGPAGTARARRGSRALRRRAERRGLRAVQARGAWDDGLTGVAGGRSGPLVAYCGSAGMVHDMDTLLRATERLAERVPDSLFLFVGPVEAQVEELLQRAPRLADRVHVTGVVPHEKVPSYLAAADLTLGGLPQRVRLPAQGLRVHGDGQARRRRRRGAGPSVAGGVAQRHGRGHRQAGGAGRCRGPRSCPSPRTPEGRWGLRRGRWAVENGSWSVTAATMLSLIREKVLQARS